MTEDEAKKQKKKQRRIFWSRFFGYIAIGLLIPMAFLIWRFQLFRSESQITFGGWGVVVVIFTAIFMLKLMKQASFATDSVLGKQILDALRKIFVPLFTVTFCLFAVKEFITELIEFFTVLTVCEPIAYVINPLPALMKEVEKSKEENKMSKFVKFFWSNKI